MRKLATASFSFAGALFISRYFLHHDWLLIAASAMALCSLIGLFFRNYTRLRIIIIFLSLAIGFSWSFFYTALFVEPSRQLHEQTETVSAIITDFPIERTRGFRVDVRISQNNAPSVSARLYYFQEIDLKPGDAVEFTAGFRRADETDEGDRLDFLSSRGIFLSAYVTGNINLTDSESSLLYFPRILSGRISEKVGEIFPDDVSPFMQALLTGHREELNKDVALNSALTGSGIIHVVSISGMHVAFLMGFLGILIKDRRLFAFWGIPILFLFMAMTGFTPAVTRAGIMQACLICAPIFKRESDSITSLSTALLLLLIINPYAISSVGLQLSFSATLGILLFSSRINNTLIKPLRATRLYKNRLPKYFLNYIVSGFATTIGALIFTFPLTAIHFGYVSLISPITNLLALWAVSIAFPLGLVAGTLAFIHDYLAIIIVYPVTLLVRYIISVARLLASVPYSVIYSTNAPLMFWLGYVYILFISLPLLKARLRQYLLPVCTAFILLFAVLLITPSVSNDYETSITVLDVGQGLSVVISSDEHTALIDCGSISGENAGAIAHEFLANRGKTAIDLMIITHFHTDHISGIEFLLSRMSVGALAIPDPDGSFLAEDIIELARKRGTDIIYVTQAVNVALGDMEFIIYPPLGSGDENERGLAILTLGEISALITGDMNSSSERALLRFAALPEIDLLVVGHHGSRHSTSEELLATTKPAIAIIPVGRNSFGHPADEVLERLEQYGAIVYRTDQMGHVTVGVNS
jgi:competence protein ComEC